MAIFSNYGRKMKKLVVTLTVAVAVGCMALPAFAGIRFSSGGSNVPLKVSFKAVRPIVNVGERVRFKVKGNQQFYLYLFSLSDRGQAHVILPNKLQQYNLYKPGLDYVVPEKNLEFFADKPGTEEVIMVATTRKLELNTRRFKEAGQFYVASKEVVEAEVKELKVRSRQAKAQQVVKSLRIAVVGTPQSSFGITAGSPSVTPFVSCDRPLYRDGDTVTINYGADASGYIYLWYRDGNNMPQFLKKEYVEGGRFHQVRATAEAPYGKHELYAVWSADGAEMAKDLFDGVATKGLSLQQNDAPNQSAVCSFTIVQ